MGFGSVMVVANIVKKTIPYIRVCTHIYMALRDNEATMQWVYKPSHNTSTVKSRLQATPSDYMLADIRDDTGERERERARERERERIRKR